MQAANVYYEGLCPSCGEFTNLLEEYGWCLACVAESLGRTVCQNCYARPAPKGKSWCEPCRAAYYEKIHYPNIQELAEREGLSIRAARKQYFEQKRPNCACCGRPITRSNHKSRFCTRTEQCKQAQLNYRNLMRRNGAKLTVEVATRIAVGGIKIATAEITARSAQ